MNRLGTSEKKQIIVAITWDYLLKTGLSEASIGDLCKETKLSQSSLYYWFENKDDIWISAGKYGVSKVVDALLKYTLAHVADIRTYFDTLLSVVDTYKHDLRLAIQITTNPVFGDRMREKAYDFQPWYEQYGEKIMEISGCTALQAEVFIYSVIAIIMDYVIWDDAEKSQMLLENLYKRIIRTIHPGEME